jgi:hypothetical protein
VPDLARSRAVSPCAIRCCLAGGADLIDEGGDRLRDFVGNRDEWARSYLDPVSPWHRATFVHLIRRAGLVRVVVS